MSSKKLSPRLGVGGSKHLLGLDFGKYLLSSENRRGGGTETGTMDTENTTEGTESELSDWELGQNYYGQQSISENSEESDEFGMFDTVIDSGDRHRLDNRFDGSNRRYDHTDRQSNQQFLHGVGGGGVITQLNNSHNDSAYGGSGVLYPIHESGSQLSESSGEDNSDGTLSGHGSPVHNNKPVYGRYQKIHQQASGSGSGSGNGHDSTDTDDELDTLMLHRLPGENLGMILGIEGGKDGSANVTSVSVKSVTLGGAAYRATGSSKGLCVGDEIVQVNNTDLRTLNHDECISVFKDMPLRVLLGVKRGQKDLPPVSISPLPRPVSNPSSAALLNQHPYMDNHPPYMDNNNSSNTHKTPNHRSSSQQVQARIRRDISDSEDEGGSAGFAMYHVTIEKEPDETLGLSIVPSYGSTKEYYQIKRILPSGAAAQSGVLHVGDRLISCNGASLQGLTQHTCLSIIKSASAHGDISFEVIRPVYDGSPMEISVTLNNSPRLPSYDPQQFSLKSQSYDRSNVDVVVTSESDDYLTVSEDEYSRKRLADIPEIEANEVFATNSVKLAFQTPSSTIDEEVTETEEEEAIPVTNVDSARDAEIVDLNRIDNSPYHIPKQNKDLKTVPKTDIDSLTSVSDSKYSKGELPKIDLDTTSLTSVSSLSPRSPVPSSDLEIVSTSFSYNKRQQVPTQSGERGFSPPLSYPPESVEENIPVSDIDAIRYNPIYEDSNISDFTDSDQAPDIYIASPSFGNKRQNIPYSDLDKISVASNRSVPQTEIDKVSVDSDSEEGQLEETPSSLAPSTEEDTPLPPPVEFSDNIDNNQTFVNGGDRDIYLPYTNLDDYVQDSESTVDISPSHHQIEVVEREKETHHKLDLEPSFRELERASDDKLYDIHDLDDDRELAFNSELTAPFDSVLQDPSLCVQSTNIPVEYSDTVGDEILQVVQSYDDGTVVISQFDPQDKRESTDSPTHFNPGTKYHDNTMDTNSEAMLKDALDMEYENMPESSKLEKRVNLGNSYDADKPDLDDPYYENENIVAENIAAEMRKNEQGDNGYFLESDDEPDQEVNAPDLPDEPPPMLDVLLGHGQLLNAPASQKVDINVSYKQNEPGTNGIVVDSNWSLKPKVLDNGDAENANGVDEEIVPVKKERKVEIPQKLIDEKADVEDDVIVAVKTERQHSIPSHFSPVEKKVTTVIIANDDMLESVPPKPAPRKNITNISVNNEEEPVQEEVIEPSKCNKDMAKSVVNVINVVNALKAASKDKDPDVVDKIVKEDVKDKLKNKVSTVIGVNGNNSVEISPPKQEQIVSQKDTITFSVKRKLDKESPKQDKNEVDDRDNQKDTDQVSPPKKDMMEETIESVKKPAAKTVLNISSSHSGGDSKVDKIQEKVDQPEVSSAMKTSITVENKQPAKEPEVAAPIAAKREQPPPKPSAPPPTLPKPVREKPDTSAPVTEKTDTISVPASKTPSSDQVPSPTSDKVPTLAYKTTIGVTNKPDITEKRALQPTPQIKPLSHIKPLSFNPKSLSQAKPVQYKTTISAPGTKSGLSSLGKSSLLSSQRTTQHPIKRMETLPFEVSILKGILGIGIKTTMTPEGYVKVSEILPNGPVGREGNIQVGDYLVSINNTPLTGLPDSKVQQILRLLPRGLSKIVASAVPPDGSQSQGGGGDKPAPSPTQPAAPVVQQQHQASVVSTSPKPGTLSTRPVPSLRSSTKANDTSPQVSPRSPITITPVISPRKVEPVQLAPQISPRSPKSPSPVASPRQQGVTVAPRQQETLISSRSPKSSPYTSPVVSPREPESEPKSPRTPPAVAPKPKRPVQTFDEPTVEPVKTEIIESVPAVGKTSNEPIETEIFASINGSKEDHVPSVQSGPNILPGSVNYDSIQTTDKTEWTQGVVSSADLSGKTDVVSDTVSHSDIDVNLTLNAPKCDTDTDNNEQKHAPEKDSVKEASDSNAISKEEISETFEKLSQVDTESPAITRQRTFSASSDTSSYTEFNECNVEDAIIPEQIEEEEAVNVKHLEVQQNEDKQSSNGDYESDFDEEEDGKDNNNDNVALRALAENIVSEVIASVKEMNLDTAASTDSGIEDQNSASTPPLLPDLEPPTAATDDDDKPDVPDTRPPPLPQQEMPDKLQDKVAEADDESPPVPNEAPPLLPDAPPPEEEAPPLPTEAPPIPSEAPPIPAPVVDLTLYPDESDGEVKEEMVETETTSASFTSPMHATAPNVDIVTSQTVDETVKTVLTDNDFLSQQVIRDSKEQEDGDVTSKPNDLNKDEDINETVQDGDGDKNISDVISMYADIEQKADADFNVGVQDNTVNVDNSIEEIHSENKPDVSSVHEETESCDTKSLTSSEDFISDVYIVDNSTATTEASAEKTSIVSGQTDSVKPVNGDQTEVVKPEEPASTKLNGHEKKVPDINLRDSSDERTDSLSPRSETKSSPRSLDAFLSELESPKQKFSPELDRMIRMMSSSSEEPKHEGEGEILHLKLNRGVTGVGFLIQGGKGSPKGDVPITVKRIYKAGPADGLLEIDDELLEVDGEDMTVMRLLEARTHLKFLPSGDVDIAIRRYKRVEMEEGDDEGIV